MNKILNSQALLIVGLLLWGVIAVLSTTDILRAILTPSHYGFNPANTDFSRQSLSNYLISSMPRSIIYYLLVFLGWKAFVR